MRKSTGYFAAVYDGHGGHQIAVQVASKLHFILEDELAKGTKPIKAIENAYTLMESQLLHDFESAFWIGFPKAGYVGSCVLTALV